MHSMYKNSYPFFMSSIGFLCIALLLMTVGGAVQGFGFLISIFITEYVIVLLPIYVIGKLGRVNLKSALRLNAIPFEVVLRIIIMSVFFLPIVGFVNYFAIFLLSFGGYVQPNPIPNAYSLHTLILHIVLVALSAGLCEEIFFRGMMLNALESRINSKKAVFWVAILFGVFHFNMQNFFGPVILGILFGHLVIVTDSLWSSIIAHSMNNGLAVIMGYYLEKNHAISDIGMESVTNIPSEEYIPSLIFLGIIAIVSLFIVRKNYKAIVKICEDKKISYNFKNSIVEKSEEKLSHFENDINQISSACKDNIYENQYTNESQYFDENQHKSDKNIKKGIRWYELLPILAVCAIYLIYMRDVFLNG